VNYRDRLDGEALRYAGMLRDLCIWGTLAITVISGSLYVQKAMVLYRKNKPPGMDS
jgi:hypothetical protein